MHLYIILEKKNYSLHLGSGSTGLLTPALTGPLAGTLKGAGPFCRAGSNVQGDRLPVREVAVLPEHVTEHVEDAFPSGPAWAACHSAQSRGVPRTGEVQGWAAGFPPSGGHQHAGQSEQDFPTTPPATRPDGQMCLLIATGDAGMLTCPHGSRAGLTGGTSTSRATGTFVTGSCTLGGRVCAPARVCARVSMHRCA